MYPEFPDFEFCGGLVERVAFQCARVSSSREMSTPTGGIGGGLGEGDAVGKELRLRGIANEKDKIAKLEALDHPLWDHQSALQSAPPLRLGWRRLHRPET